MRLDDGAEGVGERIQPRAVHQGDGPGAVGAVLAVVVVVVFLAIGAQVGILAGEHVPGQGGIDHPGGEDLRRRDDEPVDDVLELIGHLDGARQAGVEDEVVEMHRDRPGEFFQGDPGDVGG